jgi:hypothetical protein
MSKGLNGYEFQEVQSYSVGFKHQYPIFTVSRNEAQYARVVQAAIEKTLLDMGKPVLDTVSTRIFMQYGCLLAGCYARPSMLKSVLSEMFGNSHADIITSIKMNLGEQVRQQPIQKFLSKL